MDELNHHFTTIAARLAAAGGLWRKVSPGPAAHPVAIRSAMMRYPPPPVTPARNTKLTAASLLLIRFLFQHDQYLAIGPVGIAMRFPIRYQRVTGYIFAHRFP